MNWGEYTQAIMALLFVLALIGLLTLVARKFGFGLPSPMVGHKNKRVTVLEITNLDVKRKLVLVKRDNTEHLILLGINNEQIVESYASENMSALSITKDQPAIK